MGIIDPLKIAKRAQANKRRNRHIRRARLLASGKLRPKNACRVYALKDDAGAVVYVGQTRLSLEARMAYHLKAVSPTGSPIQRWMVAHACTIHLLDANGFWDVSEVVWIERMRAAGEPLMNANLGGRDSRAKIPRRPA